MARSVYIYIVDSFIGPIAAFTVKHELMSWWQEHKHMHERQRFVVLRLRDGRRTGEDTTDITSEMPV